MNNADAADALKQHEEMAARRARNAKRYPPMRSEPLTDKWCPVMTPEEKAELEERIKKFNLPF